MSVHIGVVGAGFMGQLAHLSNYEHVEDCELVALAEPRSTLRRRVARRYDIEETYHDHQALLSKAAVDAIVAPQPYGRHYALVPDVLEAGVPIFTEKPIAVKPETGEQLADLATEHDVTYMVGYHKRSDPAMEYASEVVEEWRADPAAGDLQYVRITMPRGDWTAGAPDPITTEEPVPETPMESPPLEFGEEVGEAYDDYINYYVHQINALRFFLGPVEVAFADDAEQLLVVENAEGVTGVLEQEPYRTSDDWHERVLVGFEDGYVRVDLPAPLVRQESGSVEIVRDDDGTTTTRPTMPPIAAMRRQAENFVAAVQGRREPPCDAREAVGDLEVASEYFRRLDTARP
jgi:predicted dehydrogenase